MAVEVVMPKLGMTMVEGKLVEWLKPHGVEVRQGDPIFRLETEKIQYEVEAEADGVLYHAADAGAVIPSGQVVAYLLAPGEEPPAAAPVPPAVAEPAEANIEIPRAPVGEQGWVRASPAARRLARELSVDLRHVRGTGPDGRVLEQDVQAYHEVMLGAQAPAGKASPVARRLAEQHGIDLATVRGTGPGGRVTQEDVERALVEGPALGPSREAAPVAPQPAAARLGKAAAGETAPYTGMRRTIGERMRASLQEMAQLTITMDADVTEAVRLRNQLVEEWGPSGIRVTYTDLVARAAVRALREHPALNASLDGEVIRLHPHVHLGVAVALDDGLIVPVVRNAEALSLKQLARAAADLAERARAGRLGVDDVTGGTFTVTSLGMYEVDAFTPIVNPPQCAILGVGRVRTVPAFVGETVERRNTMVLSLSFDHRLVDGVPAARFLGRVRQLLERPYLLLVEE